MLVYSKTMRFVSRGFAEYPPLSFAMNMQYRYMPSCTSLDFSVRGAWRSSNIATDTFGEQLRVTEKCP